MMHVFAGLLLNTFFDIAFSQDVFGCGGFVQSTVPIKYEKVEVCLLLLNLLNCNPLIMPCSLHMVPMLTIST